jgi:hypothetical protein
VRRTAIVSVLSLVSAGCGGTGPGTGRLYPTTGRIILADGKPLTGGSVRFIPIAGGSPATGKVRPDGTFSLTTKAREGAAPGEYKVRIEPSPELLSRKGGAARKVPFPARYRNYEGDTGLTATVERRATRLEPFRLEAK